MQNKYYSFIEFEKGDAMYNSHSKINLFITVSVFLIISATLIGCGDSQGVTTLNAHLSEFSALVENYEAAVTTDQSKQAELDAKIEAMSAKWTNIRNEFGSEITPHKMDELVKQYDQLMLTLSNIKKAIGS